MPLCQPPWLTLWRREPSRGISVWCYQCQSRCTCFKCKGHCYLHYILRLSLSGNLCINHCHSCHRQQRMSCWLARGCWHMAACLSITPKISGFWSTYTYTMSERCHITHRTHKWFNTSHCSASMQVTCVHVRWEQSILHGLHNYSSCAQTLWKVQNPSYIFMWFLYLEIEKTP